MASPLGLLRLGPHGAGWGLCQAQAVGKLGRGARCFQPPLSLKVRGMGGGSVVNGRLTVHSKWTGGGGEEVNI